MKHTGKYEAALFTLIPSNPKEWLPSSVELLTMASSIDRLTAQVVEDSRRMASKFEAYADEVEARGEGWSPMGYSTLRDIEVNIAKLEVFKESIIGLLRATLGPDAPKKFRRALEN